MIKSFREHVEINKHNDMYKYENVKVKRWMWWKRKKGKWNFKKLSTKRKKKGFKYLKKKD